MCLGEGSSGWLQCAQAKNLWHSPGKLIQQPRRCFWLLGALNLVGEAVNSTTSLWYQEKWEKCCKMQKQDTMELGVGGTVMPGSFHGGSGLWAAPWLLSSRENGGVGGRGCVGGGEWRRQGTVPGGNTEAGSEGLFWARPGSYTWAQASPGNAGEMYLEVFVEVSICQLLLTAIGHRGKSNIIVFT